MSHLFGFVSVGEEIINVSFYHSKFLTVTKDRLIREKQTEVD